MKRRHFLQQAGLCAAACTGLARHGLAQATTQPKPNILFLFTDDQTYRSIHALNHPAVRTPHLDRLVRNGVTFTHAFNQGSWTGAICIASRAMLNTGQFVYRAQQSIGNERQEIAPTVPLWGETLGKNGYDTFFTGKWHNGDQALKTSFQHLGPHSGGFFPSTPVEGAAYNRPAPGNPWSPYDKSQKGHWLQEEEGGIIHSSEKWANAAVEYLQTQTGLNPFFMYVAFHAPHDPRQAPKEYLDLYPLDQIELPPNFLAEHPFDQGERHTLRDEVLAPFPRTEEAIKIHLQEYYAILTHTDAQIGRILDALEASGQAENTLIFFSADNGLAMGQHGLLGKQNQYEHSIRMPLILAGPGLPKNKTIDAPVYIHSLYATSCDLAGIATPETVEFPSLLPLIRGEKDALHECIFGSFAGFQRMIRTERYKLIVYPKAGEVQLFDLQTDPWEQTNLAADPAHAETIRSLKDRLRKLQHEVGDTLILE